jgi:hypothetical protein
MIASTKSQKVPTYRQIHIYLSLFKQNVGLKKKMQKRRHRCNNPILVAREEVATYRVHDEPGIDLFHGDGDAKVEHKVSRRQRIGELGTG